MKIRALTEKDTVKVLKIGATLSFIISLVVLSGCVPTTGGGAMTTRRGSSDFASYSPSVQRQLRNMDVTGAVNTIMSGPTVCGSELVRGASQDIDWEAFVSSSQRSGSNFDGSFGRVEFYNNSHLSLPGGAGITATGNRRHLDETMLDVLPFLAIAHQRHGQAVRVSHTTTGRHSTNSRHYTGKAIDIDPVPQTSSNRRRIFDEIISTLASSGRGCGYFVYLESSHIHISFKGVGNSGGCPGSAIQ